MFKHCGILVLLESVPNNLLGNRRWFGTILLRLFHWSTTAARKETIAGFKAALYPY
jgi:hypothetical protein